MKVHVIIEEFEKNTGATVIYASKVGSQLHGTATKDSDTDIKGIFVPSMESVLRKRDKSHFTKSTGNSKSKNGSEDVDFQMHSIYEFFRLLVKSDAGALELLFSMFSKSHNIIHEVEWAVDMIRQNYFNLINSNIKSFVGYAMGQASKYGIKSTKYNELIEFSEFISKLSLSRGLTIRQQHRYIEYFLEDNHFKHIKFESMDGGEIDQHSNLNILGKYYEAGVRLNYLSEILVGMQNKFGSRTKAVAKSLGKSDFKALAHAYRLIREATQLLLTDRIEFPLHYAKEILFIKEGKATTKEILSDLEVKIEHLWEYSKATRLNSKSNIELMDLITLQLLNKLD